jgi:hypothetical protein
LPFLLLGPDTVTISEIKGKYHKERGDKDKGKQINEKMSYALFLKQIRLAANEINLVVHTTSLRRT